MLIKSTDILPLIIENTSQFFYEVEENLMFSAEQLYESTETYITRMMPVLEYISEPIFRDI
jgi:hypothetical protein